MCSSDLTGTISESKSMKLSAVNACVEVLSNTISKLPVYVIDGNTKAKLKNHPLAHLLSVRPNEAMTPSVAKKLTHCNILLGGNGYQIGVLILMVAGGIAGGICGRAINKKIDEKTVDKLFIALMVLMIVINIYNIFKFM